VHPAQVERKTGGNFDSSIRANAIMLDVLVEIAPNNPGIPVLVKELTKSAKAGEWYTTQDNAFAFLALGKVLKKHRKSDFTGEITAGGRSFGKFDKKELTVEDTRLAGKKVTVRIEGKGECYVYWQVSGVPVKPDFPEYDKGIRVSREYLGLDGKPLDYKAIKQGQLVIGKITMEALTADMENVAVDDMLPAGLEIENPRLATSAQIAWIKDKGFVPSYMDIRDDRLLLYVNLERGKKVEFYYALRAITRGVFRLPPVSAEAMYDPTVTSIESSGMVTVVQE
jgi:alpha-2-macroglobulin